MLLGLNGKMRSGKDTIYERLAYIYGADRVERLSFADPLKDSVCALFSITREQLESMKNDSGSKLELAQYNGVTRRMTMREFLQLYGTESHRDIFGENFWVNLALPPVTGLSLNGLTEPFPGKIVVVCDCRFDSEAQRIKEYGGQIWQVIGAEQDTGGHDSEKGISSNFINLSIDNSVRDDEFASLDAQLKDLVENQLGVVV